MNKKKLISRMIKLFTLVMLINAFLNNGLVSAKADEIKDPKLVLSSYEVVSEKLKAGSDGEIRLIIKNESASIDAYNVLLSYASVDNKLYPVYGKSNQEYIGTIKAGELVAVNIKISVSDIVETNSILTNFGLSGFNGQQNFYNEFFIAVPVIEKLSLKVNNVSVASESELGSKSLVSVGFANDGLEDIYNAKLIIEGNVEKSQKEVSLGNLLVGDNKYMDYYVIFTEEGNQKLDVYFSYEDANGNKYTSEPSKHEVNVKSSQGTTDTNAYASNNQSNTNSNIWMFFVGLGFLLILIVAILSIKKNNK